LAIEAHPADCELRTRVALLRKGHQLGGGGLEVTTLIGAQRVGHIGMSADGA
jgi:hypothetical protein